jgi:hypothetical protein
MQSTVNITGPGATDPNQKRKLKQYLEEKIVECLNEHLTDSQQATFKFAVDIKKVENKKVK